MALKFITHFEWIAIALDPPGGDTVLWDEEDGFYYDVMRMPDGSDDPAQGPLARRPAAAVRGHRVRRRRRSTRHPAFIGARRSSSSAHFSDAVPALAHLPGPEPGGPAAARRSSTSRGCGGSSRRCSTRRSSSARTGSARSRAGTSTRRACSTGTASATRSRYLPAESDTGMFGGNSNWRGPVWFPMNLVILRGLLPAAPLLRRPAEGRVPDRLRARDEPARGRDRDRPAPDARRSPEDERRAPAGVRRDRDVPDRSALARPAALPRVLPRRQRRRHRRQPPDRLDRDRRAAASRSAAALRAEPARPPASPSDRRVVRLPAPPDGLRDQHRGLAASGSAASAGGRSRSTRCPPPSGTRSRRCRSTPSG